MADRSYSKACCTIPPVSAEYKEQGEYIDVNGMKTYMTGSASATAAILIIYDIFGFSSQIFQGADILAYADEHHKFQVFVPDMFQAEPAAIEWYPPEETGRGKELMEWFGRKASPEENATKIIPLVNAITIRSEGVIHKWAALGMCWGGKIVALTSGIGTPFTAVSEVHPGLVDPADAARVVVPMCVLASKDENAEKIKQFVQALRVEKHVETFHDQVHGWMAARADLADKRVREEFRRGYQTVLNFFVRYL